MGANAALMAAARARHSPARPPQRARPKPRAVAGGRVRGIRWDRISRVAMLAVLFGLMLLFIGPARSYVSTWQKSKHERAVVAQLKRENARLRARRAALTHPAVLEREARSLGMTQPGERVFVLRGLPK
jgi:cell division protein FtsB